MTGPDLHVEARDQDITMPGTSFRVVYRKPHHGSQLVAKLEGLKASGLRLARLSGPTTSPSAGAASEWAAIFNG